MVIGGGTGTYTVLTGIKKFNWEISVIVTMMDSGGSNRVIRDEFGLLPTSDIRQCIVALADEKSNKLLRKLFNYRYVKGTGISGMTFGNLFMAALTDITGSQSKAILKTSELFGVKGKIIPVTFDDVHLAAKYTDGKEVLGEHYIDEPENLKNTQRIKKLWVFPTAVANPDALSVVKNADLIILGPGDLYTSTICNLVIGKLGSAIKKSRGKVIYITNLMTRVGQTDNFTASEHVMEIEKYIGGRYVDYVLLNNDFSIIPKEALALYKKTKAKPVKDDLGKLKKNGTQVIRGNFISDRVYKKPSSDLLIRSLIRHDSEKLAQAIAGLS